MKLDKLNQKYGKGGRSSTNKKDIFTLTVMEKNEPVEVHDGLIVTLYYSESKAIAAGKKYEKENKGKKVFINYGQYEIPSGDVLGDAYISLPVTDKKYSAGGNTESGWEKQKEWKGNPKLGYESYKKMFKGPTGKKIPVYIFGTEKDGWSYVVSAGANSDYSHTGGFPENIRHGKVEDAMKFVDEKDSSSKLIFAKGGKTSKSKLDNSFIGHSVSHATLRDEDLYSSFTEFLEENRNLLSEKSRKKLDKIKSEWKDADDNVRGMIINEDLFDMMNEIAPEGTSFGAHEGDGSDFGFWEYEEGFAKGGSAGGKKYIFESHEERGTWTIDVSDAKTGNTKWDYMFEGGEDETSLVDDGFMKNMNDMNGLEEYLQNMKVIGKDDSLILEKDYKDPYEDLYQFVIPTWAISALVNDDRSGLSDEDEKKLDQFIEKTIKKYGNANFIIGDDEDQQPYFSHRNDIDGNLGADVEKMYLRKEEGFAKGGSVNKKFHSGRYLTLSLKNGNLCIKLTKEGRDWVKENGLVTENNFNDLLDDIRGNSELLYFRDASDVRIGMTNAPIITEGYYYGDTELESNEDARVWWYPDYQVKDAFKDIGTKEGVCFEASPENKFAEGGSVKKTESMSKVVNEIPGDQDYPERTIIVGITEDGSIVTMDIDNGVRYGNKKPHFSMTGTEVIPFTMSAAKKYAKQFWTSFFEDQPEELESMNERFNKKFRTAASGAQFVLDTDGELHGFDQYGEFGEVPIGKKDYVFLHQGGGQNRDTFNRLTVKYLPDELLQRLLGLWDTYHINEMPADVKIPVIEQDRGAILEDAVKRIEGKKFAAGGKPVGSTGLFDHGGSVKYKVIDGTSYHDETPKEVIDVLERAMKNKTRIVLDYGDVKTGKSWGDQYDIKGYVSRSTGNIKIPILIYNSSSMGGGGILDHCIVKISESKGGKVLYQHPDYKAASFAKGGSLGDYNDKSAYDDHIYAHEIELYAENNSDLHRQRYVPSMKNQAKKLRKGIFDLEKSAILWKYWVEDADKRYQKEVLGRTPQGFLLSVNDRKLLAARQAAFTKEEFDANGLEGYEKGGSVEGDRVDDVLHHYMVAALWSSIVNDEDNDEQYNLDEKFDIHDIDDKTKEYMRGIVEKFLKDNDADIKEAELTDEQVGHSLWLSQNGHGAGFFDYPGEAADRLQDAARKLEEIDLEVGDGKIHAIQALYKDGGTAPETVDVKNEAERIVNQEANVYTENRLPFKGSNLEGKVLDNGDYLVLSFGFYPIWYWCGKNNSWYGNADKFSVATAKHISQSRPAWDATILPLPELMNTMKQDQDSHYELGGMMIRSGIPLTTDNTLGAHAGSALPAQDVI